MSAEIRSQKSALSDHRSRGAHAATLAPSPHPHHQSSIVTRRPPRRAFSLIEVMVVVGIILLLLALTVAVSSVLTAKAETSATQDAFKLLDTALQEWETASERQITYGISGNPSDPSPGMRYDIEQTTPASAVDDARATTRHLLFIINKNPQARAILANLDKDLLVKIEDPPPGSIPDNEELKFVDAADYEVITVFPGRLWVPSDPYDEDIDGTIRTEFEQKYGICQNRRPRFVSAGPDGDFGDVDHGSPNPQPDKAAGDNIYSYPVEVDPNP